MEKPERNMEKDTENIGKISPFKYPFYPYDITDSFSYLARCLPPIFTYITPTLPALLRLHLIVPWGAALGRCLFHHELWNITKSKSKSFSLYLLLLFLEMLHKWFMLEKLRRLAKKQMF